MYVPLAGAVTVNCAIALPKSSPMIAPVGDTSRIQGSKVADVTPSPMLSTIASPWVAVKDHGSTSPTVMVPGWAAPLVSGPPSSPGGMLKVPGALTRVSR